MQLQSGVIRAERKKLLAVTKNISKPIEWASVLTGIQHMEINVEKPAILQRLIFLLTQILVR
ncbi:hypothetical protein ACO0K3_02695 [Undibacterium sp. Rencai35W]|uniref:hypothetical protein n=1 Tax=Undibacterium sp. Rencai35W TaxID=3413046 RepID=UPI003BF3BF50